MTAATVNTNNTPTAEAIQEALAFLKNLSEKGFTESTEKAESFFNSDIFKTIEAALKSSAEAKTSASTVEEDNSEGQAEKAHRDRFARAAAQDDEDEEDMDADDGDDEDEEDNPFAGEYYWNPGPEWKTIGLVAGGAALVGLGALLYKLFND